jgi:hypothetical protein
VLLLSWLVLSGEGVPRAALAQETPASAARATALSARHEHGQTFLTWSVPAGSGWRYRVYRSDRPLVTGADLAAAELYAELGDSTALDRRLSRLTGVLHGHVVRESPREELEPGQGLCVVTPVTAAPRYYAVTAQPPSAPEDRTLVAGENTLAAPILEELELPVPVRQRSVRHGGRDISVYTLFVSHVDTPVFPAMANRPGVAFDCGIVQEVPGPAPGMLLLKPHARGGQFLDASAGTRTPGEYVLALDDPLPNGENTFWFGYHTGYDVTRRDNLPPLSGVVVDYTFRRVRHTIDWALRTFPIDPQRVYGFGYSMGGIGSMEFALWLPGRVAAVMSVMGKFDFSFLDEPDPTSWFNRSHNMRRTVDQMWGTVETGLLLPDGTPVYDRVNLDRVVAKAGARDVPPIIAINGKRDNVVGWAEKLGFYAAMRQHRHGGAFYWDASEHYGLNGPNLWMPIVDPAALYRFRSNVSYPAFTNCELDSDPGDGTFASGDSVGHINGQLDWAGSPADHPTLWQAIVMTRALPTLKGVLPAPEYCYADVTPTRLQNFRLPPGTAVAYKVNRLADNALLAKGTVLTDALGRPTAPHVRIYQSGTLVTFNPVTTLEAPPGATSARTTLALGGNPVRGTLRFSARWPAGTPGRVELLDVAGRAVRTLYEGPQPPAGELAVEVGRLSPGVYIVLVAAGGEQASERVVVMR